jgi:serine/threonine protein kinase/tetratricopeptide (TPR) repeat protein
MNNPSPLESIFFAALQKQPGPERSEYLDQACAGDVELRRQLERMLAAQADAGSFMERPALAGDATINHSIIEGPGTVIGHYKLLEQIGEGGFGVVYLADQEKPVKRRVALKVIKAGMDTHGVIARFEAERQALAMMDHPNIARVLDAGATDGGRPYFVMELVKGIPITDYCDQANLEMRQRLLLFMDVCRAVQHAHQKGVIHRDLKPSNIMITLHDSKPVVKVIDFGIAKATDHKLTEKTLFTHYGQMIGTPVYMSPEQAVMSGLDVDTRSDIYSLGVLLYELLTGSPPFDAQTLRKAGFDEMRRIIREQAPQKPSTRLSTLGEDVKLTVASQRQVSPQVLSRQLHGDLDWIILKAIEKDRARRYESASAFAQDIERHLKSEPVMAAAPSAAYRFRKFVQRNKGPMAAAAAIVILLLAGTAISTWQAIRATHAEASESLRADSERHAKDDLQIEKAKADTAAAAEKAANQIATKRLDQVLKANDMLGSIFWTLDPKEIAKNDRPLQAILVEKFDKAIAQLDGDSIGDPLVVAAMQHTFGGSLLGLGQPQKAVILLEKALATQKEKLGPAHRDTLLTMNHLGLAYHDSGKTELALKLLEEAFKLRQTNSVQLDEELLMSGGNLAQLYLEAGKRKLGIALFEETLKLAESVLGPDHRGTLTLTNNLALAYQHEGQQKRALPLFETVLEKGQLLWGPDDPQTLTCMDNLAGCYNELGKHEEAVALYEQVFKREKVILGLDHVDTLTSMHDLAGAYRDAGKLDLALSMGEEALKLLKIKAGPEYPITIYCMDSLARTYQALGKYDQALPLNQQALALAKKVFPPDDGEIDAITSNLADLYGLTNRRDLAIPLLEETLKRRRARLGDANPGTLNTINSLAVTYYKEKQYDKAIALYEESLKGTQAIFGRDHENTAFIIAYLGKNYLEAGQIDKAVPLLEETWQAVRKYPELMRFGPSLVECYIRQGKTGQAAQLAKTIIPNATQANPDDKRLYAGKLASKARALLDQKEFAQAEPLLRECLTLREKLQPGEWLTYNTQSMLGYALMGQKKYDEAEPLLIAGYEGLKKVESEIFPPARNRLTESLQRLVVFYQSRNAAGDDEKAQKFYKLLQEHPLRK